MANAFPSLQKQNLCDQIVQHIGLRIVRKEFKLADTFWSQQELSQQFQVRRSILRAAQRSQTADRAAHQLVFLTRQNIVPWTPIPGERRKGAQSHNELMTLQKSW